MSNTFGTLFRMTTFGESHGPGIGVVLDGVPAGMMLSESDIQLELDRRKPGQSAVTTPRKEADIVEILSGVFEGKTSGAPVALLIRNSDQRSKDYSAIKNLYRPGHADYPYDMKYGNRDYRGGGRSSGRETACRVAAGAVAKKFLKEKGVSVIAYTKSVDGVEGQSVDYSVIEANSVRAADALAAAKMEARIKEVRATGDSVGGVIEAIVMGYPVGLGEPLYDKLDALLSHAIMSIGAFKGIEFGAGFEHARMRGSESNDAFFHDGKRVRTETNHCGGILGGLSSGEDIVLRAALKAPSSISVAQKTVTREGEAATVEVHGRHDPCLCPRAVPVVEAMISVVLMDCFLQGGANKLNEVF